MNTIGKKITAGSIATAMLVTSLFVGAGNNPTEEFLIVPVSSIREHYWEQSHQRPIDVQYSDDAEFVILSFESNEIPVGLRDLETYTSEQMDEIRHSETEGFYNSTLAMEEREQYFAIDNIYVEDNGNIDLGI